MIDTPTGMYMMKFIMIRAQVNVLMFLDLVSKD